MCTHPSQTLNITNSQFFDVSRHQQDLLRVAREARNAGALRSPLRRRARRSGMLGFVTRLAGVLVFIR